jgi:hypothetical protein
MSFRNDYTPAWESCTPSDTDFVDYVGLYVGATGDLAVQCEAGATVVFASVPAGALIPGRFVRVMSTSTTAGDILGATA